MQGRLLSESVLIHGVRRPRATPGPVMSCTAWSSSPPEIWSSSPPRVDATSRRWLPRDSTLQNYRTSLKGRLARYVTTDSVEDFGLLSKVRDHGRGRQCRGAEQARRYTSMSVAFTQSGQEPAAARFVRALSLPEDIHSLLCFSKSHTRTHGASKTSQGAEQPRLEYRT